MMVGVNPWLIAGRCCAAVGWAGWIVVQLVNHDPFPPEISLSQYGLGATGWLFSVWVIVLAAGPLVLLRYRPVPGPARSLVLIGFLATVVMALVRTDEGAPQMTAHAKVHMAAAVVALVFLPLGMLAALRYAERRWFRLGIALVAVGALVGVLILLAAAGMDTAGWGPGRSWALWQGILIVIEMLLVTLFAAAIKTVEPGSVHHALGTSVKSAHQ
jgi:hypothetical protein